MTLFELEQQVWDIEGVRIAFIPPMDTQIDYPSYVEKYPEGMPAETLVSEFEKRIISIVGYGVRFIVLSGLPEAVMLNVSESPSTIH